MNVAKEFKRYSVLVSSVRALRQAGEDDAEMIDELEVLEMHADSPAVKMYCSRALREFRAPPPAAGAARG